MKKVLALFCVFTLLLGSFSVLASSAANISIGSATGYIGDTVSVDLMLHTNPGFGVLGINVGYDNTKLQLISVTDKKVFTNDDPERPYTNTGLDAELDINPYLIIWSDDLTLYNTTDTGKLATFTFKILANANLGTNPITLSVLNCYKADIKMTPVPTTVTNGSVNVLESPDTLAVIFQSNGGSYVASKSATFNSTVTPPKEPTRPWHTFKGWYKDNQFTALWSFESDIVRANTTLYAKWELTVPGDIDGDGQVDLKDVTVLSRQIAGWLDLTVVLEALDTNADGQVDLKDVTLLSRFIAGWEVTL